MKIVITTPILFDKSSPFNHLMHDILQGLLNSGNKVTRIVAVENEFDTDYRMGLDGIEYIPVKRSKSVKANIIKRYITDTVTNIKMARLIGKTKSDILFEDVSYSSFWSVKAAKKAGMRVVAMIQDVWPDNAVQSGIIKGNSLIYRYFESWQRKVYEKSDKIICISNDMKAFVASKNVASGKISVIYNWGYSDDTVNIPWGENEFVKKYNLSRRYFYAVYAGNIGRMQNVELILRAAEQLKGNGNIKFLIVGDGVRLDAIKEMAFEMELTNLTFLPMQPTELATSIYSAADVNIIPLVPDGVKTALPSKTGVCLSCGQPIIFAFGNDCRFADNVSRFRAGYTTSASDCRELARAIENIASRGETVKHFDFFVSNFRRSLNMIEYEREITG